MPVSRVLVQERGVVGLWVNGDTRELGVARRWWLQEAIEARSL